MEPVGALAAPFFPESVEPMISEEAPPFVELIAVYWTGSIEASVTLEPGALLVTDILLVTGVDCSSVI